MSNNEKQIQTLREKAKIHESQGNSILSDLMKSSANHLARIQKETDSFLDKFLARETTNYATRETRKTEFRSQWYSYEDEYSYNFSMD